ncbi:hypothetical protein HGA91_00110 [candidate division WWE3 bacterium]|nr:hypothetical protein [candidate division WWE3 bacterium]
MDMLLQAVFLVAVFLLYWIGTMFWNPTGFHMNYWIVSSGAFFPTVVETSGVLVLVALIYGQLDWLKSGELNDMEKGTITDEGIGFKTIRSVFAGFVEEISHRGYFIYGAILTVFISNKVWPFALLFTFVVLAILIFMRLGTIFGWISVVGLGWWYVSIITSGETDLVYAWYEQYVFPTYRWIIGADGRQTLMIAIAAVAGIQIVGILSMKLISMVLSPDMTKDRAKWLGVVRFKRIFSWTTVLMICIQSIVEGILWYVLVTHIDPEVTLQGPTILVAGMITANGWFRKGHKYQGWVGMLSSWIFGYYMLYVALHYGLWYSIIGHTLYDAVLFASEHMADRGKELLEGTPVHRIMGW